MHQLGRQLHPILLAQNVGLSDAQVAQVAQVTGWLRPSEMKVGAILSDHDEFGTWVQ